MLRYKNRLTMKERNWVKKVKGLSREGKGLELGQYASLLSECPESFRKSPDYLLYLGLFAGLLISLDANEDYEKDDIFESSMHSLFAMLEPLTPFPPPIFVFMLSRMEMTALPVIAAGWPQENEELRCLCPFVIGLYLGQVGDEEKISVGEMNELGEIISKYKRPDADEDSLI